MREFYPGPGPGQINEAICFFREYFINVHLEISKSACFNLSFSNKKISLFSNRAMGSVVRQMRKIVSWTEIRAEIIEYPPQQDYIYSVIRS